MKQYLVFNRQTGYSDEFYNLTAAKAAMKANDARGVIYKIYSGGDFVNCGEITLAGNNKTFVANSRQEKSGY
ncbi:MAG: hypothetical protein LBB79_08360 [Prevotellaceae bacterium]|jgi:hypothetical protein|nr:hypothetical protein [Prevotellaceae bacterium]